MEYRVLQVGFADFLCHVLTVRICSLFSPLVNVQYKTHVAVSVLGLVMVWLRHWAPYSFVFGYTIGKPSVTKAQAVLIYPPCIPGTTHSPTLDWVLRNKPQPDAHLPFFCGTTLITEFVLAVVVAESESLSLRLSPSSVFSRSRLFWLLCRVLRVVSSAVPSNSRAMKARPSRRMNDLPAKV